MPSVNNPDMCFNSNALWWCGYFITSFNTIIWDDLNVNWDSNSVTWDGNTIVNIADGC